MKYAIASFNTMVNISVDPMVNLEGAESAPPLPPWAMD